MLDILNNFIQEGIKRNKPNDLLVKSVEDAEYQRAIYTGEGQKDILLKYRERESVNQKKDRERITISRTKHIAHQIENVLNQLDIMDKPAISIIHEKDDVVDDLSKYVYDNNINNLAFKFVKYFNIVDANTYLVCGINKYEDIEFTAITSESVYDFYIVNDVLKWIVFKIERKYKEKIVYDYKLYYDGGILTYQNKNGGEATDQTFGDYYVSFTETKRMFAFRLGYIDDSTTNFKTCVSIIDCASVLFKSLIWQGSDLDIDIAKHGIIKQFAYAQRCNYESLDDKNGRIYCDNGLLFVNGTSSHENANCPKCNGSGMIMHTSNQDVIKFPMPNEGEQTLKLSDLTHTVFLPESILQSKKQYIAEIKDEIIKTIFNASIVTKDEIAATATEKVIDLQGIYATLNLLGKQVSECFIWMVECIAELKDYEGVEVVHGYTLNLKLESVETLMEKRAKAIQANAPIEIIKAIDLAILQKQHIDSPKFINRYSVWERYRPFADKSDIVAIQILAGLPATNKYKILYNFFGQIKQNIIAEHGDAFFDYDDKKRDALINSEVEKIKAEIEASEPQRINFAE
jgi:hypothetical protein